MSEPVKQHLSQLGIQEQISEEDAVLTGSAILSKIKKANFTTTHIPFSKNKSINDNENVCGRKSIKHLYMIVDGAFENALPEFLHNLGKNKKCLPPEILPDLLNQSLTSPELWSKLKQSIGKKGRMAYSSKP